MPPIRTLKPRKLVLGRETLRALTRPRTNQVDLTVGGDVTSCGEVCTCDCEIRTF